MYLRSTSNFLSTLNDPKLPRSLLTFTNAQLTQNKAYTSQKGRWGWQPRKLEIDYQSTKDHNLMLKQRESFKPLTPAVYIQKKEVETYDGYKLIEPSLDPNKKPHELHLIKKIANFFGEPYWIRDAMKKLGFESKREKEWRVVYSVQPNTTQVNELLWLCKHLVKITPIKFKNGYPTEMDLKNSRLNLQTGEFEILKKLELHPAESGRLDCYESNGVMVSEDLHPYDNFPLRKKDLLKDMHRQKQLCKLNDEYFPAVYDYKYDQDKPGVRRIKGKPNTNIEEDDVDDSF